MCNPFQKNPADFCYEKSQLSPEIRERFKKAKTLDEVIRMADKLTEAVAYLMEGNNYSTLDEANAFLKQIQNKWNTTPRPELFEHSPYEVSRLIHDLPFQDLKAMMGNVDLSPNVEEIKDASLYRNWVRFLNYVSLNEVSATVKGNINRKTVSELKNILEIDGLMAEHKNWIRNEQDWVELSDIRFFAESVSLIKKRKNRWFATKKCTELLQRDDQQGLYILLFDAWFNQLDWGSIARTDLQKKVDFQRDRFFLLSALLRTSSEWMGYYEFLHVLHDDFLRLKCEDQGFGNVHRDSHLGFLFHYPFFDYLEGMNILEIARSKIEGRLFAAPIKFRVTNLGKQFIELLLKGGS